jgi:hypothetical protein
MCLGAWGHSEAFNPGLDACKQDIAQFCPGIQPGGGRLAECLRRHEGELSAACREGSAAARSKLKATHEACAGDVQKYCGEIQPGGGRVARCLQEKRKDLSPECRDRLGTPAGKGRKYTDPPSPKPTFPKQISIVTCRFRLDFVNRHH